MGLVHSLSKQLSMDNMQIHRNPFETIIVHIFFFSLGQIENAIDLQEFLARRLAF